MAVAPDNQFQYQRVVEANGIFIAQGQSIAQSVPNNTLTTVVWTRAQFGYENLALASNNIYVVPADGFYNINAAVVFASNNVGRRTVTINRNNSGALADNIVSQTVDGAAGGDTYVDVKGLYRLKRGDTLRVNVTQTSGGALNIQANSNTYWHINPVHHRPERIAL